MFKFLGKLLLFVSVPIFLVVSSAYNLISQPIGQEGFRAWENLSVLEKNDILTGPFYPNMFLHRVEYGDQFKPASFEVPKEVIWQTDKYGFRKRPTDREEVDIVVMGDSFTAGSTLTQSDMFTEKLEKITQRVVYPYAPSHIKAFMADPRFISHPPRVVILAMAEKLFQDVPEIDAEFKPTRSSTYLQLVASNDGAQKVAIIFDRLKKKYFFDYMRKKVYEILENLRVNLTDMFKKEVALSSDPSKKVNQPSKVEDNPGFNIATDGSMVFSVQADDYFMPLTDRQVNFHVWKMTGYRNYLKSKGIRFMVAVIPNKENIYYKLLKGNKSKPDFIKRFNDKAREAGLEVADIQAAFDKSYEKSSKDLLFEIDDSHWNAKGAQLAAEEVAKIIQKP